MVETTLLCEVRRAVTNTIAHLGSFGGRNRTVRVQVGKQVLLCLVQTVSPIPTALFRVEDASITNAVSDSRAIVNLAIRMFCIDRSAVPSIPAALFRVVDVSITKSVTNSRTVLNRTIATVAMVETTLLCEVRRAVTNTIAHLGSFGGRDLTVRVQDGK